MIELTYRRGTRIKIKTGLGQPSPMSQVPDDALISTLVDGVAGLLFPIETKKFESHEEADQFAERYTTKNSWVIQISRKVLASG
jgi:hypothetical protein